MRFILSLLLATYAVSQFILDTDFEQHPNMVCQMYNAWAEDPSTPGFIGFEVVDYANGAALTRNIAATALTKDGTATAQANGDYRRSRTCGTSYCRRLITYGPNQVGGGLSFEQALNDHNYPAPSIPRPPGVALPGGFGKGWDYESMIYQMDARDVVQCDEYPYASTYEGGDGHGYIARVNCILGPENGGHGNMLKNFYGLHGMGDRAPFYVRARRIPSTLLISQNPLTVRCPNLCWNSQQWPIPAGIPANHIIQATPNIACIVD